MEKGDLISRSALIAMCDKPHWCVWMNEIEDAPAVDAVEVVRCKDCMHRYSARCPMCVKTVKGVIIWEATTDDGFCHKGLAEEKLHACHECGEIWSEKDEPKWDGVTCPECGAKMDGRVKE